jgi:hypothetical protein
VSLEQGQSTATMGVNERSCERVMHSDSSGQGCEPVTCYKVCSECECIRLTSFVLSCGMIMFERSGCVGGDYEQ